MNSISVVVGCIIFFVTFFGCCGAIKEHHCMTLAFSVFLSLILLIELGAGCASYAFRQQVLLPKSRHLHLSTLIYFTLMIYLAQVGKIIESNMEKGLQNYAKPSYKGVTETWNIVQHEVTYISTFIFLKITYSLRANS